MSKIHKNTQNTYAEIKQGKRPKFKQGNPGKPKGSANKFTDLKQAYLDVFDQIEKKSLEKESAIKSFFHLFQKLRDFIVQGSLEHLPSSFLNQPIKGRLRFRNHSTFVCFCGNIVHERILSDPSRSLLNFVSQHRIRFFLSYTRFDYISIMTYS